jgi:hypothetical protein
MHRLVAGARNVLLVTDLLLARVKEKQKAKVQPLKKEGWRLEAQKERPKQAAWDWLM